MKGLKRTLDIELPYFSVFAHPKSKVGRHDSWFIGITLGNRFEVGVDRDWVGEFDKDAHYGKYYLYAQKLNKGTYSDYFRWPKE